MREPEIVLPLRQVIGKLIGEAEPEAPGHASRIDQVDSGDLGLLPAIARECRHLERCPGAHDAGAIALVEPLRLRAHETGGRFATPEPVRNMRIESVCAPSCAASACMLSRLSAEPRWVRPVPVR